VQRQFVSGCVNSVGCFDFGFGNSSAVAGLVVSGICCLTFTSGRRQQSKQQQRLKKELSAATICFRLGQLSRLFGLDFDNNNNETFGSGPDSCGKA
jgi:hypothetical protein